MQNEENTLDTQEAEQESETGTVEETEPGQETEGTQSEPPVDPDKKLTYEDKLALAKTPEEKFAIADAEANKNRRLLGKSKPTASQPRATQKASPHNVEETVLLAQGMPEELVTSLKKVAAVEDIPSLIKAQTNPLFVAIKDKYEREQKQKASAMPASRGAGSARAPKTFNTPGLSRDDHRALFQKSLNS